MVSCFHSSGKCYKTRKKTTLNLWIVVNRIKCKRFLNRKPITRRRYIHTFIYERLLYISSGPLVFVHHKAVPSSFKLDHWQPSWFWVGIRCLETGLKIACFGLKPGQATGWPCVSFRFEIASSCLWFPGTSIIKKSLLKFFSFHEAIKTQLPVGRRYPARRSGWRFGNTKHET